MSEKRTPDAIMNDFARGCTGQADIDMHAVLWEIIEDILDSIELAFKDAPMIGTRDYIVATVTDYVINHYD